MANLKDIGYGIGKYLVASDASAIPGIGNNRKNLDLLNFKVAVNNAYSLYNFKDGIIDGYQDQTGVDLTASTGEIYNSTDKTFDSADPNASTGFLVTGGLQTFTVPAGVTSMDIKCFGASSGVDNSGFSTGTLGTAGGTQYAVVVGEMKPAGGPGTFSGIAYGGGGQGYHYPSSGGLSGVFTGTSAISFTSTTDQDRAIIIAGGGAGRSGSGNAWGGAGGGLGAAGSGPFNYPATNIATTDSAYENAGFNSGTGGTQSSAGSFPNCNSGNVMQGGDSTASDEMPGGGGGYYGGSGGRQPATGGGGGSGYVGTQNGLTAGATYYSHDANETKINDPDYPGDKIAKVLFKYSLVNDISLVSNTQTAIGDDPTEGRLILYEEDVDSITLDTDLKGYVSRDNGTTYTQTPLVQDEAVIGRSSGIDQYTKLLLHCDGANTGTTFTDSSSLYPGQTAHVVTANGDAQTSTTQKKFGTAAYKATFAGAGYLTIPHSTDFSYGTGDFTVEMWLYATEWNGYPNIYNNTGSNFGIYYNTNTGVMNAMIASTDYAYSWNTGAGSPYVGKITNEWFHFACTRASNTLRMFVNGTEIGSSQTAAGNINATSTLWLGSNPSPGDYWRGYMDEIRLSKGIARWTSDFTVPNVMYGNPHRMLSGSVDISGQPAGSDMKYKVETLNSKNLKLHGASLLWA